MKTILNEIKQLLRRKGIFLFLFVLITSVTITSCDDDDDDDNGQPAVKTIEVSLSTSHEIPPVPNRTETGTANLRLLMDSTLRFDITVNNLKDDELTVAHIHTGGPVETGPPIVVLVDNNQIKFSGNKASGSVKVNSTQYAQVMSSADLYVNVHSTDFPDGLVRGQINKTFKYATNVELKPLANPGRPETGYAALRVTNDSVLHYKVVVNNLLAGDVLTAANIHSGAAGGSGTVLIPLLTTGTEFGTAKTVKLTASQMQSLLNSPVYVNITSTQLPVELVRGQIR